MGYLVRPYLQMALCLGATACGVTADEQIADRMETAVRNSGLPISSIGDYSQYYLKQKDGAVIGIFVMHIPNSGEWRNIVKAECVRQRLTDYPCDQSDYGVVDAGKRKWVPSESGLPVMAGGGCGVVEIHISASRGKISRPECNGPL